MKPPTPKRPWWEIEPDKDIACPHCDFSSGYRGMDTCGKCGGTGRIKESEYFNQDASFPGTGERVIADTPAFRRNGESSIKGEADDTNTP